MLDLMEMRGFNPEKHPFADRYLLTTPDGSGYAIQMFEHKTTIECAFAAFESLNHMFP